ncbi:eclosion hormone-like [Uloborus diversus]|uniref:eclosion hormone-like n=1 Tax=Uloborus diversus TaxID=327109 RepID=UPI0024093179|nr:eclosion hormone-like [Uloborus diversus]
MVATKICSMRCSKGEQETSNISRATSLKMVSKKFSLLVIAILLSSISESLSGRHVAVCIQNCAQCKRTFGPFFEGQRCAEWCIRVQGSSLPDCSELDSIAEFLTKLE